MSGADIFKTVMDVAAAGARPLQVRFALERLTSLQGRLTGLSLAVDLIDDDIAREIKKTGIVAAMEADIAYIRSQVTGIK